MRRRDFIAGLGAAAWPLAARSQQRASPVVGFIYPGSLDANTSNVATFRKGLNESGYVEGQNVTVEYHWLEGAYDRLPALTADLVRRRVAVIAITGSLPAALAAKTATSTIPIVFGIAEDPVRFWACRQPGPAGRQRDRHQFFRDRGDRQAAGTPA